MDFVCFEKEHKLQKFEVCRDSEDKKMVFLSHMVSREDGLVRDTFKTLISESVKLLIPMLRGLYSLEIPMCRLHTSLESFDMKNFVQLLARQCNQMSFNERKIIFYAGSYFYIQKRVPLDYGKMEIVFPFESFSGAPEKIDLFLKKKLNGVDAEGSVLWIEDLSLSPIMRDGDGEQWARLRSLMGSDQGDVRIYYRHDKSGFSLDLKKGLI